MKPYGLRVVEYPDVKDLLYMGAGNDARRPVFRSTKQKMAVRRKWKARARRAAKKAIERDTE